MSKQQFSPKALAIWSQITGNKGFLSSNRVQGLVDILNREIGLAPVMVRYGKEYEPFDLTKFLAWRTRDFPDDYCSVFYAPDDCAEATGSGVHNWTQWAARLLDYGRGSHVLAPRMKPPEEVIAVMDNKGQLGQRVKVTRFLSLEVVVFYFAAQARTWGEHRQTRVLAVKDLISRNDVSTVPFVPSFQEPVDVDDLFPSTGGRTAAKDPSGVFPRVPKAGQGLVNYNPGTGRVPPVELWNLPTPADKPAARQPVNAPVNAPSLDLSTLDDDGLEAHIQALQAALNERRARARKAEYREQAGQAVILHTDDNSEVWSDRPQYATMTVRYPDGAEVTYYHEQLMVERVSSGERLVQDLNKALKEQGPPRIS